MTRPDPAWDWFFSPLLTLAGSPVSPARLLSTIVLIVAAWGIAARVERAIRRFGQHHGTNPSSFNIWARVTRYAIWALAIAMGLDVVGMKLSSFALLGGAVGVGIGFGLQNIFSNFFSGLILLLEKTLKEGDFVDLQSGTRGSVREIGMRYTRITTNDDVDVIVPNSEFINGRVINWTFGSPYRRLHIGFGVAYGSDKNAVREAALRAARAVPATVDDEAHKADVWLVRMNDSSLDFELIVWVGPTAISSPARVEAAYRWQVHEEILASGLEFPFPQRDLNIRSGELQVCLRRSSWPSTSSSSTAHPEERPSSLG